MFEISCWPGFVQVLSDFIVKNRGVFTVSPSDASNNFQVPILHIRFSLPRTCMLHADRVAVGANEDGQKDDQSLLVKTMLVLHFVICPNVLLLPKKQNFVRA